MWVGIDISLHTRTVPQLPLVYLALLWRDEDLNLLLLYVSSSTLGAPSFCLSEGGGGCRAAEHRQFLSCQRLPVLEDQRPV